MIFNEPWAIVFSLILMNICVAFLTKHHSPFLWFSHPVGYHFSGPFTVQESTWSYFTSNSRGDHVAQVWTVWISYSLGHSDLFRNGHVALESQYDTMRLLLEATWKRLSLFLAQLEPKGILLPCRKSSSDNGVNREKAGARTQRKSMSDDCLSPCI